MSGLVRIWRAEGREFQIVGAATLKLWAPNEVQTYGMESKLIFVRFGMHEVNAASFTEVDRIVHVV